MVQGGYKVELSPRALRDLEQIVTFIAADNPPAAEKFGQQLIDQADAIGPHPFAGRVVPELGDPLIRERIFRSYRIVYRVHDAQKLVVVSRFWHAARGEPQIGSSQ